MTDRIERDSLGEKEVPEFAYYGPQTARALENFPISGLRMHPEMIKAVARVKQAAAETNMMLKQLDPAVGDAIVQAAREVAEGLWFDHFPVDVFQAGAGVSFNMNANEVIANRAAEILGETRGEYKRVHPNDHVNMSQSTNDVFPTSLRLAALALSGRLLPELDRLEEAFRARASEFQDIVKPGRTHLQDAVPVRMGQEFDAYAAAVHRAAEGIRHSIASLQEVGLGGTAVGTGLNSSPTYRAAVVNRLTELTGLDLRPAPDLFEVTQSHAAFAQVSAALKVLAQELVRIANDIRLMNSGPNTGFAELNLPPVQPGSSIMPGKVNPVMAEALDMICFQVIAADLAVSLACQAGQLELNVMTPVIAFNLLQSLDILANGCRLFRERCLAGMSANRERCRQLAERSLGMATVLNRYIGYDAAAKIAQQSLATGRSARELVLEKGLISRDQVARIFDAAGIT